MSELQDYQTSYKEQVLLNAACQQRLWQNQEVMNNLRRQLSDALHQLHESQQTLEGVRAANKALQAALKLSKEAADTYQQNWLNAIENQELAA